MNARLRLPAAGLALFVAALLWSPPAAGGGYFLPAHGARGIGRGGAMVAADGDPGVLWYNPAGIAGERAVRLLVDASVAVADLSYTRVDSGGNPRPTVQGDPQPLPLPTVAISVPLPRNLWVGGSLATPLIAGTNFPRPSYRPCTATDPTGCLDTADDDAPQRYSSVTLDGTQLLRLDLGVAWRPVPELTVGLSAQTYFARLSVLKAISSYNGVAGGAPEDPEFDSLALFTMSDQFNPSAQLGARYVPTPWLAVGAAVQLPFLFDAEGEVDVQLPASPLYAASSVEGRHARISMMFPLEVAVGVELRPTARLRLAADFRWQYWSGTGDDCGAGSALEGQQCEMLVHPEDIYILDLPGIPRYKVPPVSEHLGFRDALSAHVGAEYELSTWGLVLRAGYSYERGAVTPAARSTMANDPNKHLLAVGGSVRLWRVRIDLSYAAMLTAPLTVDFRTSEARQVNPIRPELAARVGGGEYTTTAHIMSLAGSLAF